jgi:hypothetical protein
VESPENESTCFPPFPHTLEIATGEHRNMNITRSDSHIPSAPAASMNQFQIPKGQNPLRLPFASFRLIFGLEKTAPSLRKKTGGFLLFPVPCSQSFTLTVGSTDNPGLSR